MPATTIDYAAFFAQVHSALRLHLGNDPALKIIHAGELIADPQQRTLFFKDVLADMYAVARGQPALSLKERDKYKRPIVSVREFVEGEYYLDSKNILYPKVMAELEIMNNGEYQEAVLTGAIGTGKTTLALYATAFQLYKLSCLKNPHEMFGLDPASEILFVFQSINANLAKAVDFARFRTMIAKSQYFKENFAFNKDLESELKFPNRIIVKPVSGSESAAIGQNVIGGILDELNYMALIDNSKLSIDAGSYDQAMALYNSIARRRQSRFMQAGKLPGLLCLVSSKRYPGQFTDKKEDEARREIARTGKTKIYVYDKRVWDIKPAGSFTLPTFRVFIGDEARRPRILEKGERLVQYGADTEEHLVVDIPGEYLSEFETDLMNALRDIAGVATLSKHPFIVNRESIGKAMRRTNIAFESERVDFEEYQLSILASEIIEPKLPRFFHCDLAISGDSAGFAVGTVPGFKSITSVSGALEMLPMIHIDALLEIAPPKGREIKLFKVRDIIHTLRRMGVNVRWGTFDQFQSRDSMQLLKQAGLSIGYQSVDTTMAPYEFLKNALYDGRLSMPYHAKCAIELASLEKVVKKNKVDHPPNGGSKDVSDALAGVVYGLTMRREIWALHGISAVTIPTAIREASAREKADKLTTTV